jgi:hypothetical protein
MVDVCDDAEVAYVLLFHYCKTKLFEANTKLLQLLKKVIFVVRPNRNILSFNFTINKDTVTLIMKKLIYLFCTLFAIQLSAQQDATYDSRLLFRYEAEFLNNLQTTNPSQLNYLNFYVANSYSFYQHQEIPAEKLHQFPDILELISAPDGYDLPLVIDQSNFNILLFDVVFKENQSNAYRIGDTNVVVYLKSKKEIYTLFNEIN